MSDIEQITTAEAATGLSSNGPRHTGKNKDRPRSLAADAWDDLRRNKIFWVAGILVVVIVIMAAFPSLFTQADPRQCILARQHGDPTGQAYFGYDFQGCDVFARTIYGTRNSISVGIVATLISGVIGLIFGLATGFFGGWIDAILSRFIDVILGVPFLLGAIVLAKRFAQDSTSDGKLAVMVTLGVLGWTTAARIMRSSVISAKNQDYVAAARMLGAGPGRIMLRHILPNSIAPFIVVLTILLGTDIATEATLSYLGVGLKGGAISWGIAISDAGPYVRTAWEPLVWPSVFLAVTVLAFIMLGDAVRDAFDPKLR